MAENRPAALEPALPKPPLFSPATGLAPVDMIGFGHSPNVEARRHEATDILLMHLHGSTVGARSHARIDGSQWDSLVLARGVGQAISGHAAGTPFEVPAHHDLRTGFAPRGIDIDVEFAVTSTARTIMFPPGYLAALLPEAQRTELRPVIYQPDERLAQLVRLMETEMLMPGFASRLMVEGLARAIAAIVTTIDMAPANAEAERIHLTPAKLRRVTDFMAENLDRNIGLDDLARVAGLSMFHFSRVFKLSTGSTPYQYILDQRLARSRALLTQSTLSLAELSLACGFANQSHFTAAFTKAVGVSPGRFRRQSS